MTVCAQEQQQHTGSSSMHQFCKMAAVQQTVLVDLSMPAAACWTHYVQSLICQAWMIIYKVFFFPFQR
jgi:hypothetical protein